MGRARRVSMFIAVALSGALLAASAAVPGIDDPIDVEAGPPRRPGSSITVPPPASGPPRPSWGCNATPPDLSPFDGTRTIGSGGQQREYLLHVPQLTQGRPAPLVIDLHGLGTNAALQSNVTQWNALADREGFVVAHPQGLNNVWTFVPDGKNPDLAFVKAAVLAVMTERCIDVSRVYATGLSMGGLLSTALVCTAPDVFAAVGLVAGMQWKPECEPAPPRAAIVFWGELDCVLPWFGTMGPCLAIGAPGRTQPTAPVPPDQDGGFPPVEQMIVDWAQHNGCNPEPQVQPVSQNVTHRVYAGCQPGGSVELYFIAGGGHTWPGSEVLAGIEANNPQSAQRGVTTREINATELIWEFFQRHQLA